MQGRIVQAGGLGYVHLAAVPGGIKKREVLFMSKIAVIYWSQTGNTEAMARPSLRAQQMLELMFPC